MDFNVLDVFGFIIHLERPHLSCYSCGNNKKKHFKMTKSGCIKLETNTEKRWKFTHSLIIIFLNKKRVAQGNIIISVWVSTFIWKINLSNNIVFSSVMNWFNTKCKEDSVTTHLSDHANIWHLHDILEHLSIKDDCSLFFQPTF